MTAACNLLVSHCSTHLTHQKSLPVSCCVLLTCRTAEQSTKNAELQRARVLQEIGAMLRVQHHPHAVKLLDVFEDSKGYQLVMPLLKGARCCAACSFYVFVNVIWSSCYAVGSSEHHIVGLHS